MAEGDAVRRKHRGGAMREHRAIANLDRVRRPRRQRRQEPIERCAESVCIGGGEPHLGKLEEQRAERVPQAFDERRDDLVPCNAWIEKRGLAVAAMRQAAIGLDEESEAGSGLRLQSPSLLGRHRPVEGAVEPDRAKERRLHVLLESALRERRFSRRSRFVVDESRPARERPGRRAEPQRRRQASRDRFARLLLKQRLRRRILGKQAGLIVGAARHGWYDAKRKGASEEAKPPRRA